MNKKTIIIIISCVTALLGTIGLTYAYFTATVTGNNNASSVLVKTATLSIDYTNGNEIKAENILPGWTTSKSFTVRNTGTTTSYFRLNMNNVTNTFTRNSDLQMSISSNNINCGSRGMNLFPRSNAVGLAIGSVTAGQICTYTLTVNYLSPTGVDQSADMNASVIGKISVEAVSSSLTTNSDNLLDQSMLMNSQNYKIKSHYNGAYKAVAIPFENGTYTFTTKHTANYTTTNMVLTVGTIINTSNVTNNIYEHLSATMYNKDLTYTLNVTEGYIYFAAYSFNDTELSNFYNNVDVQIKKK